MSEKTLFVITFDHENGDIFHEQLSPNELEKKLESEYKDVKPECYPTFITELRKDMETGSGVEILVVRGEAIIPKPVKVIEKWSIE